MTESDKTQISHNHGVDNQQGGFENGRAVDQFIYLYRQVNAA